MKVKNPFTRSVLSTSPRCSQSQLTHQSLRSKFQLFWTSNCFCVCVYNSSTDLFFVLVESAVVAGCAEERVSWVECTRFVLIWNQSLSVRQMTTMKTKWDGLFVVWILSIANLKSIYKNITFVRIKTVPINDARAYSTAITFRLIVRSKSSSCFVFIVSIFQNGCPTPKLYVQSLLERSSCHGYRGQKLGHTKKSTDRLTGRQTENHSVAYANFWFLLSFGFHI